MEPFHESEIVVTCLPGLQEALAGELAELGFEPIELKPQSVRINGSFTDCMKLNLLLRCGNRVLYQVARFGAVHPDHMYKRVKKLPWEEWITETGYLSVDSYVRNPGIKDTRFANLRVKDAIVDRIADKKGTRPDSGPIKEQTVVFLHWVDKHCELYFDTSGETISKHGYRYHPFKAPLHESLAAAVIRSTEWDGESAFINPMCGSGTLAIEAALKAYKVYPAHWRRNFGFMHVKGFEEKEWEKLKEQFENDIPNQKKFPIIASDISKKAIDVAKKNARAAGVERLIEFYHCPFEQTPIPEGDGLVILNPEYGERLGEEEKLASTYREIGDFFKQKCSGKKGFIFTGNLKLAKQVGLRTSSRTKFMNAKIECRLLAYELYQGRR